MMNDTKSRIDARGLVQRPQHCPTCGKDGEFKFMGEQHWPPHVAEKLGIKPLVTLWRCPHCHTSLTVDVE